MLCCCCLASSLFLAARQTQIFTSVSTNAEAGAACQVGFFDDFNSGLGYPYTTALGFAAIAENGQLKISSDHDKFVSTTDGPAFQGNYQYDSTLKSMQLENPVTNGFYRASFSAFLAGELYAGIMVEYISGVYKYVFIVDGHEDNSPIEVAIGPQLPQEIKLRITKIGKVYSGYYNTGDGYKLIGARSDNYNGRAKLSLRIQQPEDPTTKLNVFFDDLKVTCPNQAVYRFWNASAQTHFYTISEAEKENIIATNRNWQFEGIAFHAFSKADCNNRDLVYRFWHPANRRHFYTIKPQEKDGLIANNPNWNFEGEAYCAYQSFVGISVPLYRFWSDSKQAHFYTVNEAEKQKLIDTDPSWSYEGIAYYVLPRN